MEAIKASDTWLLAKTGAVRGALLLLWAEAWQQTPCGTLPKDEELIALLIDMAHPAFQKNRRVLLRGWYEAEDGRLYHETITKRVLSMLDKRASDAKRAANRRAKTADAHVSPPEVTRDTAVSSGEVRSEFDTKHQAPEPVIKEDPTGLVGSPPVGVESGAATGRVVKLADRRIPCPADALLEAFHAECPTLPRVMKLNDRRRQHLTARWREVDSDSKFSSAEDGLEIFRAIFRKVNASDFLSGRAKAWHATFDWLTESSTNFLKVCEGHYDNESRGQPARSKQPDWMAGAI